MIKRFLTVILKIAKLKDRTLGDYKGNWQSVYPYLKDGTLDEVMEHKAEDDDSMFTKHISHIMKKVIKQI